MCIFYAILYAVIKNVNIKNITCMIFFSANEYYIYYFNLNIYL